MKKTKTEERKTSLGHMTKEEKIKYDRKKYAEFKKRFIERWDREHK